MPGRRHIFAGCNRACTAPGLLLALALAWAVMASGQVALATVPYSQFDSASAAERPYDVSIDVSGQIAADLTPEPPPPTPSPPTPPYRPTPGCKVVVTCPCQQPHLPGFEHPSEALSHPPQFSQPVRPVPSPEPNSNSSSDSSSGSSQPSLPVYSQLPNEGWSVVSAIAAGLAFLLACATALRGLSLSHRDMADYYDRRIRQPEGDAGYETAMRRSRMLLVAACVLGLSAMIAWACLEDFQQQMVTFNRFTPLVTAIFLCQLLLLIAAYLCRQTRQSVRAT